MSDEPLDLDRHRGVAAQKATDIRPILAEVCEGIIYFDAQISDRAFDLCMSEQKLDGPEIASPPVVPVVNSIVLAVDRESRDAGTRC